MQKGKHVSNLNTDGRGEWTPLAKNRRDSNIELFRIITMLLIVAHHYVVNSGLMAAEGPIYNDPLSYRSLFLLVFGAWGKTGINCFMLITGYYMCKSRITTQKFAKLLCEIMFYRVVINLAFCATGYEEYSMRDWISILIPIKKIGNGFVPAFLVFYLGIPFLSVLVNNLTEKQHVRLLLLCGFLYVFLGTVPKFSVTMNYVSWLCVIFFIAAYIRNYPQKMYENTRFCGWLLLIIIVVDIMAIVGCAWLSARTGKGYAYSCLEDCNTFLAVATSICAFLFFKNLKISYNHFINQIAVSTFGVLLIHANSDIMRRWLWNDVLDAVGHYSTPNMPLYAVGSVVFVFTVCTIIDQLRIRYVESRFLPILKLILK